MLTIAKLFMEAKFAKKFAGRLPCSWFPLSRKTDSSFKVAISSGMVPVSLFPATQTHQVSS